MASSGEKIGQEFQDNVHHNALDMLCIDRMNELEISD
jgi:hypothetical protein